MAVTALSTFYVIEFEFNSNELSIEQPPGPGYVNQRSQPGIPPFVPLGFPHGQGTGGGSDERGSPAFSFRAVLFSATANTAAALNNFSRVNGPPSLIQDSGNGAEVSKADSQDTFGLEWAQIISLRTSTIYQGDPNGQPTPNPTRPFPAGPFIVPQQAPAAVMAVQNADPSEDWTAFESRLQNGLPEEESETIDAALAGLTLSKIPIVDREAVHMTALQTAKEASLAFDWRDVGGEMVMLLALLSLYVHDR
jgi:hypothetical protein